MPRGSKLWFPAIVLLAITPPSVAQSGSHRIVAPPAPVRILATRPATSRLPVTPMFRRFPVASVSSTSITNGNSSTTDSNLVFLNGSPINLDQLLNPTPSFGFSFEHLNAVNPDLGIKAIIDPITEQRLALAERLLRETPIAPVGFPFFEGQPVVMLEQQPPVIVLQQPPTNAPASDAETQAASAPLSSEVSETPLRDVGAFTLVLHDGTELSAVAFTIQDDRIVYITSDGLRRSFPVAELDRPATEKLNEDRGTPVRLPQ